MSPALFALGVLAFAAGPGFGQQAGWQGEAGWKGKAGWQGSVGLQDPCTGAGCPGQSTATAGSGKANTTKKNPTASADSGKAKSNKDARSSKDAKSAKGSTSPKDRPPNKDASREPEKNDRLPLPDIGGLTDKAARPSGWGGNLKSDSRTIEQKLDQP